MRTHNTMAALSLSLLCTLSAAACLRDPEPSSETEGTHAAAPVIKAQDEDGDIGSEPPGGGIGSEPPAWGMGTEPPAGGAVSEPAGSADPEGWFTYRLCVLLKSGPEAARTAFCGSQPDSRVRARCYSHLKDGPVKWANWCYDEFGE